jgi:hypothetical protein
VKDDTGEILPYVSVGVLNEETGPVTNENGKFNILFKSENYNTSAKIDHELSLGVIT